MDTKLVLIVVFLILTVHQQVEAEFFYNRVHPKQDELSTTKLKCVPGRTIIKLQATDTQLNGPEPDSEEHEQGSEEYLRSHMNFKTDDESCQICICSVEGKDEYCSKRPAKNVNECLRMAALLENFNKNLPFDHEKSLSFRIRRDYLWHNDEIPYEAKAKCRRGHSYYSNSVTANDTDIDVDSDLESLLDYSNTGICYYCVCTVDGSSAGCLSRNPWFCEYYRFLRAGDAPRDMYTALFRQDRPVYFRSLSWRLRRTMDNGMFDLVEAVGSETQSKYCVPYVSQYTDCTEENLCSGCSKCTCTAAGEWYCDTIKDCPKDNKPHLKFGSLTDDDIEEAIDSLQNEIFNIDKREKAASKHPLVPEPDDNKMEDLLLEVKETSMEDEVLKLMQRKKRSADDSIKVVKENDTVSFHHVVDELNEDTLKNQNSSGTISAQKVDTLPIISRRNGMLNNTTSSALQIEYIQENEHNHRDDNKVDTPSIHDDKEDLLVHANIYNGMSNYSQDDKNKELSKILVNELKGGVAETIGDKQAPVISNITFIPENDTLTAMAFIAGNLLNRLWNLEKDASDNIDTDMLKHEKIADLLDLFKEPLNMRQEIFLKNALEQISTVVTQNKNLDNISLCKNIEEVKKILAKKKDNQNYKTENDCDKNKKTNKNTGTADALNKINVVLDLIKKYEKVQYSLSNQKSGKVNGTLRSNNKNLDDVLTKEEKSSLDLYGKTLGAITKLLIPNKKNKKLTNSIEKSNLFKTGILQKKISGIKLGNLNVTTKDKMILDYLAHIQSNPDCLLKKSQEKITLPSMEGNILLNLSDFFKIKSLSDLLKLVDAEKRPSLSSEEITTQVSVKEETTEFIKQGNSKPVREAKEKFKEHLKTILEDLIELQKGEGKEKDTQIMEALPCIYNLLNAGKEETKTFKTSLDKNILQMKKTKTIWNILIKLKAAWKFAQTRRTNTLSGPRPKSAVVWERVLKNAKEQQKSKTRRNLGKDPKTIEELKVIMDNIESSGSNTYKNYAFLIEVPPAERLLVLKTFNADTLRYIKALEQIYISLLDKSNIPKESAKEFNEFLDNVAINVNLNDKVVKNLDKAKKIEALNYTAEDRKRQMKNKVQFKLKQPIVQQPTPSRSAKLTRDQIINQVIKNRVLLYVETKDATHETQNDMNYNIAKQILYHIELGNYHIARELYKVLTNQKDMNNESNINIGFAKEQSNRPAPMRRLKVEPLIIFEEPKTFNKVQMNQDHFIKQLMNLRNKF